MMGERSTILVYLITDALSILCIARLFRYYAAEKPLFLKELAAYAIYYLITNAVYLAFGIPILNMVMNLTGLFLLTRLYEKKLKKNILMAVLTYVAMIPCEMIAMWVCNFVPQDVWQQQSGFSETAMVVQCVVLSLIVQVLKKFKGVAKSTEGDWFCWGGVVLMQIMLVGFMVMLVMHLRGVQLIRSVLMLAVIDYVVIYIYDKLILSEEERVRNLLLVEQKESYEREMEILLDSRKKIRGIYHDIKNHILIMRSYSEQKRYQELDDYLQRMQEETRAAVPQVYTGQPAVDSMLHYKISNAKEVPIQIETSIPEKLNIDDFDITVILGNLLDNAIEACEKLEKEQRKILLSIRMVKNQLFIRTENSFDGQLRRHQGRLLTRKADEGSHGIGLENVKRVVEKYHGLLEMNAEGMIFQVKIMLYLG